GCCRRRTATWRRRSGRGGSAATCSSGSTGSRAPSRCRRCASGWATLPGCSTTFSPALARETGRSGRRFGPAPSTRSAPPPWPGTLARLRAHPWPGNIRDLQSVAVYVSGVCRRQEIRPSHLDFLTDGRQPAPTDWKAAAAAALRRAIEQAWKSGEQDLGPLLGG